MNSRTTLFLLLVGVVAVNGVEKNHTKTSVQKGGATSRDSQEYLLTNTGTEETTMLADNGENVCFITHGRDWYNQGELCQILSKEVPGVVGNYWVLHKESGQGALECGARCLTLPNAGADSQEYLLSNEGTEETTMLADNGENVCFITHGHAWDNSGELCQILSKEVPGVVGNYWVLHKESGQGAMECGARCLTLPNAGADSQEYLLTDTGTEETTMLADNGENFCFITHGRAWFGDKELCQILSKEAPGVAGNYWVLHKESGQGALECGARCLTLPNIVPPPPPPTLENNRTKTVTVQ